MRIVVQRNGILKSVPVRAGLLSALTAAVNQRAGDLVSSKQIWRSTTIVAVRRAGQIAIGGDGQVSLGETIMKADAVKIRRCWVAKWWSGSPVPPPIVSACLIVSKPSFATSKAMF